MPSESSLVEQNPQYLEFPYDIVRSERFTFGTPRNLVQSIELFQNTLLE